jgi:hypothetical protein
MATRETTFLPVVSHPYYPLNATIHPYLENEWQFTTLLAVFAAGCGAIFTATTLLVKRVRPGLPTSELLTILWFVLSGCIHLFFEGTRPAPQNSGNTISPQQAITCTILEISPGYSTCLRSYGKNTHTLTLGILPKILSSFLWRPLLL